MITLGLAAAGCGNNEDRKSGPRAEGPQEGTPMELKREGFELEIEELEAKIAPDNGETILPLGPLD